MCNSAMFVHADARNYITYPELPSTSPDRMALQIVR